MIDTFLSFASSIVTSSLPLLLVALGGLFTASSGSLSIALEGSMLIGAFSTAAVGRWTGSYELGMVAGPAAGMLLSAIVAVCAIRLRADVFVAGLSANILAPGAVSAMSQAFFGTKAVVPAEILSRSRGGDGFSLFGSIGLGMSLFLAGLASIALVILYTKTVFGLRLRACRTEEVSRAAGLVPERYRFAAHLISGAASGFAGACLACGVSAFVPGMSAGRGWIALAAIFLGGLRPLGILASCILFGALFALSNLAQAIIGVPAYASELILAIPYAASVVIFILWKRYTRDAKIGGVRTAIFAKPSERQ
jgi:simple sugar transport system permease protein